ncbi:hypothetical protein ISN44_As08g025900 [Arabidopsis suecica]|uniref:Uncharacterized protein n=1 Tax=Arabidopsis suecica TaxID=45249 RepID=A0A8T2B8J0_ARASU|nr:hypothetical protein ISN44_As08g025900 [Arabidopsis suecica]
MKNSSILFVLIVVFVISSSENQKMVGEAKKCKAGWACSGEDICKEKCMAKYNGVGTVTYFSFPPETITILCDCLYDC